MFQLFSSLLAPCTTASLLCRFLARGVCARLFVGCWAVIGGGGRTYLEAWVWSGAIVEGCLCELLKNC